MGLLLRKPSGELESETDVMMANRRAYGADREGEDEDGDGGRRGCRRHTKKRIGRAEVGGASGPIALTKGRPFRGRIRGQYGRKSSN